MPELQERLSGHGPFAIVSGVLDELVSNGVLDQSRRPGSEIAAWAAVHGLATLLLDGPLALLSDEEQAAATAKVSEFVLAGITATPHPA